MAIGIHYVRLNKTRNASGYQQFNVVADAAIASSANSPTLKAYLEAEALLAYVPGPITDSFCVTLDASGLNSA